MIYPNKVATPRVGFRDVNESVTSFIVQDTNSARRCINLPDADLPSRDARTFYGSRVSGESRLTVNADSHTGLGIAVSNIIAAVDLPNEAEVLLDYAIDGHFSVQGTGNGVHGELLEVVPVVCQSGVLLSGSDPYMMTSVWSVLPDCAVRWSASSRVSATSATRQCSVQGRGTLSLEWEDSINPGSPVVVGLSFGVRHASGTGVIDQLSLSLSACLHVEPHKTYDPLT